MKIKRLQQGQIRFDAGDAGEIEIVEHMKKADCLKIRHSKTKKAGAMVVERRLVVTCQRPRGGNYENAEGEQENGDEREDQQKK